MKNLDFKKIGSYMTTLAKIISFISLALSVVIKVKMLVASSAPKDKEEKTEEPDES